MTEATQQKEILTDLDKVKNELLQYITKIESRVDCKLSLLDQRHEDSLNSFQIKVDEMALKYTSMTEIVTEHKVKFDKIEELEAFKRKCDDQLISHEIRLNNLRKEFDRAITKYDRIYLDNLIVPGYIGECAQFKNMREYIDFNIAQVSGLNTSKEKLTVDLKEYKVRLESIIKLFNTQVENYNKNQYEHINKKQVEIKTYIAEQMKIIEDEFVELRMENSKYAIELKNKSSELNVEWERMLGIKEEIYKKYDEKVKEFKQTERKTNLNVFDMSQEFKKVKKKFNELVEFIKDVRFRRNLEKFEGISKKEIQELTKKIGCTRRKSKSIDHGNNNNNNEEEEENVPIDFDYDYYKGDNKSEGEITSSKSLTAKLKKEYQQDNDEVIILEGPLDQKNEAIGKISTLSPDKSNFPYLQPKLQNQVKPLTNPQNLRLLFNENRPIITEPNNYSPPVRKMRKSIQHSKPECLRVVELNYGNDNSVLNLLELNPISHINASLKPITLRAGNEKKKFKTVKENQQAIKTCFGSSIINQKDMMTKHKESIDCSQQQPINTQSGTVNGSGFMLVSQKHSPQKHRNGEKL